MNTFSATLSLLLTMSIPSATAQTPLAEGSNTHFRWTIETTAAPENIWRIWTDVPNWPVWDAGLKSAELNGNFGLNAKGKLRPDQGPASKFKIAEFENGKMYVLKTSIPFGSLTVRRNLEVRAGRTFFTHEVRFTGLLKGVFGKKFGARYRVLLPEAMEKIKTLAEEQTR